jgi:hypothetical protein
MKKEIKELLNRLFPIGRSELRLWQFITNVIDRDLNKWFFKDLNSFIKDELSKRFYHNEKDLFENKYKIDDYMRYLYIKNMNQDLLIGFCNSYLNDFEILNWDIIISSEDKELLRNLNWKLFPLLLEEIDINYNDYVIYIPKMNEDDLNKVSLLMQRFYNHSF